MYPESMSTKRITYINKINIKLSQIWYRSYSQTAYYNWLVKVDYRKLSIHMRVRMHTLMYVCVLHPMYFHIIRKNSKRYLPIVKIDIPFHSWSWLYTICLLYLVVFLGFFYSFHLLYLGTILFYSPLSLVSFFNQTSLYAFSTLFDSRIELTKDNPML